MKIYVASSFSLVPKVRVIVDMLEGKGHEVLVRWWSRDGFDLRDKKRDNENPELFYGDPICSRIFERDFKGVSDCDVLVLVAGEDPKAFNGANIEYGIALALGKPCFSVGRLDNSAMYSPMNRSLTILGLLNALDEHADVV